jgi:ATP-dependent DNA helicase RecQ
MQEKLSFDICVGVLHLWISKEIRGQFRMSAQPVNSGFFNVPMPAVSVRKTGLSARAALKKIFGYDGFRDDQEKIVDHLVAGGSAFILKSTGGGKSICFQLPGFIRAGTNIVVSPLIALMKDQVEALRKRGIRAAALVSDMEPSEKSEIEAALLQGTLDILYVSPERLQVPSFRSLLRKVQLSLLSVDECHCVSSWGHDFRESYLALGDFVSEFPDVPVAAVTATADPVTQADIIQRLHLTGARIFKSGFDRPNIEISVQRRFSLLSDVGDIIERHKNETGIIFCPTRKGVDELEVALRRRGIPVVVYHAGMSTEERRNNQHIFTTTSPVIAVATIAFGMGIDKSNVRFVVHTAMPTTAEGYYQEIGRAGRDGLPSTAYLLHRSADTTLPMRQMLADLSEIPDGNQEARQHLFVKIQKMQDMIGFIESGQCRKKSILHLFGEEHEGRCGCCDRCKTPPVLTDHTVEVQMLIKAIASTGQRYGSNYIIEVLQGLPTERVLENEHQHLSIFGAGQRIPKREWQVYCRQLRVEGFIEPDISGVVRLGQRAWPFLKGEGRALLAGHRVRPEANVREIGVGLPEATRRRLLDLVSWRDRQAADVQAALSNRIIERLVAAAPDSVSRLVAALGLEVDIERQVRRHLKQEKLAEDASYEDIVLF